MIRVLILGGTSEALELTAKLSMIPDVEVVLSLAGRTRQPVAPAAGEVRIGGFGGLPGLVHYLQNRHINVLIDATHPFAAKISWIATAAAIAANISHLIVVRPAWVKTPEDQWIEVESVESAAQAISATAQRVFLSIGRQELTPFVNVPKVWFLMRSIDPPNLEIPNGELLLERGPFNLQQECQLLREYRIDAIVSKNSGGDATYAKIIAARELRIPVVMVQRPALPIGEKVTDVESAMEWFAEILRQLRAKNSRSPLDLK
jgi:precorrin-6A/cobalt-precorrin-6A reductase